MKQTQRLIGCLALGAFVLSACSSDSDDSDSDSADSDAACQGRGDDLADLVVEGDDGELTLVETDPATPIAGDNSFTVMLSADGEMVSGLSDDIEVEPFMPDHGHGTPIAVEITEQDDGEYLLSPVNTFMPGLWEINLSVDSDELTSDFLFSVCIE